MKIGLALSGGGFRAAAFHLGVLKRLEELGILERISTVSTVSGGSITGALYALRCAQNGGYPGAYPVDRLISEVRSVVTQNFRRRALLGSPKRIAQTLASFATRRVRRMPLLVREFDRQLFDEAPLSILPDWILINATNLATGKCWKFFHDRAGDYLIGATDMTDKITVSEAVGASAAYPVLTDPYPFRGRWEHFRADLLDNRWMRPPQRRPGDVSRWRRRYGRLEGPLSLPLVDGGLYDNEGLNGLRSARVDYAIYASTAAPSDAHSTEQGSDLLRMVKVMHGRLGAVTRQHAHEMTHGINPDAARKELANVAEELRTVLQELREGEPGAGGTALTDRLAGYAENLEDLTKVGWPPRGHQYTAIAPILLHRTDVAKNRSASYDPPYDIPSENRGLVPPLVDELARVRTDLDAYSPEVVDLLVAQAYFITDAHIKINMPKLVGAAHETEDDPQYEAEPSWNWAHEVINRANANEEATACLLRAASKRKLLFGRSPANR